MHTISTGVRHPYNLSADAKGSIHDDATAAELGFRGGTVAADIHLEQFGDILVEAFGSTWFERGSLSLYFMHALADREPVSAMLDMPDAALPATDTQVTARMETPDGVAVASGTASAGHTSEPTALYARDRRGVDPASLRMLQHVRVGQALDVQTRRPWGSDQMRRHTAGIMTAPLDWYVGDSPWGGPICSPLTTCRLLVAGMTASIEQTCGEFVGMYGAIEVRNHRGPLLLDTEYTITGRVLDVADTPKTEVLWFTTEAREVSDPGSPGSEPVASLTMMTRLLKGSSPLYAEE